MTPLKIIIQSDILSENDFIEEDGGCFLAFELTEDINDHQRFQVEVSTYDDSDSPEHQIINSFKGKKVRVTIEEIEEQ